MKTMTRMRVTQVAKLRIKYMLKKMTIKNKIHLSAVLKIQKMIKKIT